MQAGDYKPKVWIPTTHLLLLSPRCHHVRPRPWRILLTVSVCTFKTTGENHVNQRWYFCDTCWPNQAKSGCCENCVSTCHAGHKVEFARLAPFYCDCGAGAGPSPCCNLSFKSAPAAPGPAPKVRENQLFILIFQLSFKPPSQADTTSLLRGPQALKHTETKVLFLPISRLF